MDTTTTQKRQIINFGFYGLLKNIKFFEPYLHLYLIFSGLSCTMIGTLFFASAGSAHRDESRNSVATVRERKIKNMGTKSFFHKGSQLF